MTSETDQAFERGLDVVDKVYGPGVREQLVAVADSPIVEATVLQLFGQAWARGRLSMRDRRLLVLGVTATLSRADLIETQVLGALRNGEFDAEDLEEVILMLSYYAGWPNGTAVSRGVQAALKTFRAEGGKA